MRIISVVKKVKFVSDMIYYIILIGHWCDIHVLNVQVPSEDKIDDMDSFYKELELIFNDFPKYHMKILLEDFNAKVRVGREDIFKPKMLATIQSRNICLLVYCLRTSKLNTQCYNFACSSAWV
jgi:hypothetical protein